MQSLELDLIYGLIGVFLFIFKNPDKRHLYLISVFVVGLFVSQLVYFFASPLVGQITWAISALAFLMSYLLRWTPRPEKGILEYLKIVGVIMLIIFPVPFYSLVNLGDNFETVRPLTFFVVGTIYVYDRLVFKSEIMKKKFVAILVAQTVVILLLLMYAFVQKAEADKQLRRAEQQRLQAEKNAARARELEIESSKKSAN